MDSWIRARAICDLERLTDQDFGYRNPASQPELVSILQTIETWWAENRLRMTVVECEDDAA